METFKKLKIKLLAYDGAPESIYKSAVSRINRITKPEKYELVESNPDILFFLSGGSENAARKQVKPGNFYLLIGSKHDNAYASATEVKAFLNEMNIASFLLDEEEAETITFLNDFLIIKKALDNLKDKRLGLIGKVSDWLISSGIPAETLDSKLGIKLLTLPWSELNHFSKFQGSEKFLEAFAGSKVDLAETAKVSEMLAQTIQKYKLDAITVECFPMVQKDSVTACLPLAHLNNEGFPAGCEGDITAITGMILCKELTGIVPWIANINKVTESVCMFSHCTIAPGLITDLKVKTHFETGKGTAIEGNFKDDIVTIFRFNHSLSKAFIAKANVIARPKLPSACRTQIEVKLSGNEVKLLREKPLGNHHLILPGDYVQLLQFACKILGMQVLE
jgi:L-fucose isomerase-like protein